jgi:hypothetical protein
MACNPVAVLSGIQNDADGLITILLQCPIGMVPPAYYLPTEREYELLIVSND